ncbi:MAG: 30S ribosomal protein S9 [Candidatus Niyogibacteria bacterium]|nr:30S ribosomal protein S9 [Candidatus Niyogibacteria bacterium]
MLSSNLKKEKVDKKKTPKPKLEKIAVHKKKIIPEKTVDNGKKDQNYIEGVGRRKTSVARVRIIEGGKNFIVNGKDYAAYFPTLEMKRIVDGAFDKVGVLNRFGAEAHIYGGGIHSQAEALRHGLARALVKYNADFRKRLKKSSYLKRDPRMKERRKFGLKKARKSPQWKKR